MQWVKRAARRGGQYVLLVALVPIVGLLIGLLDALVCVTGATATPPKEALKRVEEAADLLFDWFVFGRDKEGW